MPRGKKSKERARERRRQALDGSQSVQDVQATEKQEEEPPSCSSPASDKAGPSSSAAGPPQNSPAAASTSTVDVAASGKRSDKGGSSQGEAGPPALHFPGITAGEMLLLKKSQMLVKYLVERYKMKQPIRHRDMLHIVRKMFQQRLPDMLKVASQCFELLFGLQLKELESDGGLYTFVSGILVPDAGSLSSGLPRGGILLCVLSVSYLNDYHIPENKVWRLLGLLGIFERVEHFAFGNAKKLITQDLVQEKYLEYHQVSDKNPPQYEFLWGPRSFAEVTMISVMQFLDKVKFMIATINNSSFNKF
ncbi:melanoma-associated antigen B17-like [Ctenodactylus gundi]